MTLFKRKEKSHSEDGPSKRKFYMPSPFLIIIGMMILFILISWIGHWLGVKVSVWDGDKKQEVQQAIVGLGLLDFIVAIWHGFVEKSQIILFILCLGGSLAVMARTKTIDSAIDRVVKKLNGKEIAIIPILMFFFGLGGSTYGMWEETIAFFPILIPVFIKAGFGTLPAVLTILVGAGAGALASTVNPFAIAVALESGNILEGGKSGFTDLAMGSRWLSFIIFETIAIAFVLFITIKIKNKKILITEIDEKANLEKFSQEGELKYELRHKVTLVIFMATFMIMIVMLIPWASLMGINTEVKNTIWDRFFFWFASVSMWSPFGDWYFVSISGLFLLMSLLVFIINRHDFIEPQKNKEQIFINTFIDGMKDLVSVALLLATAGGLSVIMGKSNVGSLIAGSLKGLSSLGFIGFGIFMFIMSIALSIIMPSTSGFASAFIPIFALAVQAGFGGGSQEATADSNAAFSILVIAFVFGSGVANLITPTSGALMAYTQYAGISYKLWLKHVWKIFVTFTLMGILLITIYGGLAMTGNLF